MTLPTGVLPKTLICQGCRGRFELFIWAWTRLFCEFWRRRMVQLVIPGSAWVQGCRPSCLTRPKMALDHAAEEVERIGEGTFASRRWNPPTCHASSRWSCCRGYGR